MKVAFIGCCYKKDIYSQNLALLARMAGAGENETRVITSNCSCFVNNRKFKIDSSELFMDECRAVTIPYVPLKLSTRYGALESAVVRYLRLNIAVEIVRGLAFFARCLRSDIIHFNQVLKAFGAVSFLSLLLVSKAFRKKVIVTINEIDPIQKDHPTLNRLYNMADRIVVFSWALKAELAALGIEDGRVRVIPYFVELQREGATRRRSRFIFFGGHHLDHSKGIETLLAAVKLLQQDLSDGQVLIYTGNKCDGVEEYKEKARSLGVDRFITWSKFLYGTDLTEAYQSAIACLIPYTSGSGKYPATMAMSNGTPVITTKGTDVCEYVEDQGIYVETGSPSALAEKMLELMRDEERGAALGRELARRAEERFSSDRMRKEYLRMYSQVLGGE